MVFQCNIDLFYKNKLSSPAYSRDSYRKFSQSSQSSTSEQLNMNKVIRRLSMSVYQIAFTLKQQVVLVLVYFDVFLAL